MMEMIMEKKWIRKKDTTANFEVKERKKRIINIESEAANKRPSEESEGGGPTVVRKQKEYKSHN